MKVLLFVDDRQERAAIAYQRMNQENQGRTIWCKSISEAIFTIYDYKDNIECIMTEHDFGGDYINTKRDDCGMALIRWIENLSKTEPTIMKAVKGIKFIIHTHNSHAGPIMQDRLVKLDIEAVWRPFGT